MKMTAARLLGVFAIAHALTHSILPMRGSFEPAYTIRDYTPIILYLVCTSGFLLAGMGLLGVRVLNVLISPMLVLSGVLSSVAIVRSGDTVLLIGVLVNAILIAVGLLHAYAGWRGLEAAELMPGLKQRHHVHPAFPRTLPR